MLPLPSGVLCALLTVDSCIYLPVLFYCHVYQGDRLTVVPEHGTYYCFKAHREGKGEGSLKVLVTF